MSPRSPFYVLALAIFAGCHSSSSSSSSTSGLTLSPAAGTLLTATSGTPYTQTFSGVSGGTPPYTFTAKTVPAGLSLAAVTPQTGLTGTLSATLSGTPSQQGLESVIMTITDANRVAIDQSWPIEIAQGAPALTVTPSTLPGGLTGQQYLVQFNASGGTTPFTWTVTTGPLPPGITFTPTSGPTAQLTGTPTTTGTFAFTITVVDGSTPARSTILNLSLTVTN